MWSPTSSARPSPPSGAKLRKNLKPRFPVMGGEEDIPALKERLAALKARLKTVRDEQQGTEACLENWKGKFGPGSPFGCSDVPGLENEALFAAEIGSVALCGEVCAPESQWSLEETEGAESGGDGTPTTTAQSGPEPAPGPSGAAPAPSAGTLRPTGEALPGAAPPVQRTYYEYRATLLPCFKTALTGLEDWSHVWVLGSCPAASAPPETFSATEMCSLPPGTPSVGVFAPEHPHGQSFHLTVTEALVRDYYATNGEAQGASAPDPYTAYLTHPQCLRFEPGEVQGLVCVLGRVVSVEASSAAVTFRTRSPLPRGFLLLDLKVYHPQVESLTNLGLEIKRRT